MSYTEIIMRYEAGVFSQEEAQEALVNLGFPKEVAAETLMEVEAELANCPWAREPVDARAECPVS